MRAADAGLPILDRDYASHVAIESGMHQGRSTEIDQHFVMPPSPDDGHGWPRPTRTAYPMKPSDTLMADGRLFSGALGRVKINQHERRVVVEWRGDAWVVVRPRLR